MSVLLQLIGSKLLGRLFHENPESKTQKATAGSIPAATGAALLLMQESDPVYQMLGGVLAIISAMLLFYKDSQDNDC